MENNTNISTNTLANHVVFCVGRFNPPTTGHMQVINKVKEVAGILDCDYKIFTTRTHDSKKNPLILEDKKYFLNNFLNEEVLDTVNVFHACRTLAEDNYQSATLVIGSDHGMTIVEQLTRYIGHSDKAKDIGLLAVQGLVVDRNNGNFSTVSGTAVREYARDGNFQSFKQNVPQSEPEIIEILYRKVRSGLGIDIEDEYRHNG